jgi:hypothetical protein
LVICCSYSGNTEETINVLHKAYELGSPIVCISSGGKMIDFCKKNVIDYIQIEGGMPPRSCLGYSMVQLAYVLGYYKIIPQKIYKEILQNYIFCDCIDKNIFLYQIWQLNDIVYIIKIYFNNFILQKHKLLNYINQNDIIFTKILTKYSSEYNNYNFIFSSTQKYSINKKNLFLYIYSKNKHLHEINEPNDTFNNDDDESKLLHKRIMKLIAQYTNYSLSNSSKFLQTTDTIEDEFFH